MIPEIGKVSSMEVVKRVDFGWYLDGGPFGEILLPNREGNGEIEVGQEVEVFLYTDTEDRLVATTKTPMGMVGDFVKLKVADVNKFGAFFDWGIQKQLFVPFREQRQKMNVGEEWVVYIYFDELTERIVGSTKLNRYVTGSKTKRKLGETVEVLITEKTKLGYKAIIDNNVWGLLYANEIFEKIVIGEYRKAKIKRLRADGKIDLFLVKKFDNNLLSISEVIFQKLEENDGVLELGDKSEPSEIYEKLKMSKKNFKKGIGILYKNQKITISPKKIVKK